MTRVEAVSAVYQEYKQIGIPSIKLLIPFAGIMHGQLQGVCFVLQGDRLILLGEKSDCSRYLLVDLHRLTPIM